MSASRLRAFAISAESIARLMPKFASKKALTAGEAAHLARQLQTGAEAALSIAIEIERGRSIDVDEQKLRAATAAMLNSPAWPAVFQAGSAEVSRAPRSVPRLTSNSGPQNEHRNQGFRLAHRHELVLIPERYGMRA